MAHAQKPHFVFPRNGRVNLNRWGRQFSRLLAAEVCASALICWIYHVRRWRESTGYPLHSPVSPSLPRPVRPRVPQGSERALHPVAQHTDFTKKILFSKCHTASGRACLNAIWFTVIRNVRASFRGVSRKSHIYSQFYSQTFHNEFHPYGTIKVERAGGGI